MQHAQLEKLDLREKGGVKDGQPQFSDRRLYAQFLAFGDCADTDVVARSLEQTGVEGVIYNDINDPKGIGLLVLHEDADFFVTKLRQMLNADPWRGLVPKPRYTTLGRTYSVGYEPDLEDWLLRKPRRTALNPDWPWAIWYPLRRSGAFEGLDGQQQRQILMEHAAIGRTFGESGYAQDIRLACHGLDTNDNDFVIGLIGGQLYPLSAIIQAMRKTTQTSQYLTSLGPFFVGKAIWQSPLPGAQP